MCDVCVGPIALLVFHLRDTVFIIAGVYTAAGRTHYVSLVIARDVELQLTERGSD